MSEARSGRRVVAHPRRSGAIWVLWVFTALLALLPSLACQRSGSPTDQQSRPVDPALLGFLSHARSAHHRADLLEDESKPEQALGELHKVLEGPMPAEGRQLSEVREVLADTRARAADLCSRLDRFDEAERHLASGLELTPDPTYFRGHLLEVRGLVAERRARSLAQRGQQLLAEAGKRWEKGSPQAERRDALLARLEPDATAPATDAAGAVDPSLHKLRAELEELQRGRLSEKEQREVSELLLAAQRARKRALEAFEQSMDVQARVIESSRPSGGQD